MGNLFKKFKEQIFKFEKKIEEYTGSTKSSSNPALSYVEWASKLLEQGNEEEAIVKLETATEMAVKNPEACVNLALTYLKRGEINKVPPLLKKAVKIDSQYARAYLAYGLYYTTNKDFENAERYYGIAANLDPRLPDVFINWAVSLVSQGKNKEAQDKFEKARYYNPNNLVGLYLWAVLDIEMNDYETARKKLSVVLSFQPTNAEALFSMAYAYYKEGKYNFAVEFANNALQYNSNNPQIYALLADSYAAMNKYDKADEIYETGDKKHFNNEKFYLSWGENAFKNKDYEKSIRAYKSVLNINPDSISAKDGLASNYMVSGNYEEAKNLILKIISKVDDNSNLYIKLANIENNLKNYNKAIEYTYKAIKGNINNSYLYYELGLLYEKTGDLIKAKDAYASMLEYHSDNNDVLYRYAKLCLNSDPKESLRKIRTAYNADKENYDYALLYAEALKANELTKSAEDVIDKAISDFPEDINLIYEKTEILLIVNKYDEAIELLYGLPQDKKDNEKFDYMLIWAYILRANSTDSKNHINEMNDFSYYLSQKYGKNNDFMIKLKSLEDKYKQKD